MASDDFTHNDAENLDDVIEVRILNDYGKDEMWKAVALSLPSMWMTGFVVHRLVRLNKLALPNRLYSIPPVGGR